MKERVKKEALCLTEMTRKFHGFLIIFQKFYFKQYLQHLKFWVLEFSFPSHNFHENQIKMLFIIGEVEESLFDSDCETLWFFGKVISR